MYPVTEVLLQGNLVFASTNFTELPFLCFLLDRTLWDYLGKYKFERHLHNSHGWVSDFSKAEKCFGSLP